MKVKRDETTGKSVSYMDPSIPSYEYSTDGAIPLEVSPGSIVLLDGNLTHFSYKNTSSNKQRHAYTLHIVEGGNGVKYSEWNWI